MSLKNINLYIYACMDAKMLNPFMFIHSTKVLTSNINATVSNHAYYVHIYSYQNVLTCMQMYSCDVWSDLWKRVTALYDFNLVFRWASKNFTVYFTVFKSTAFAHSKLCIVKVNALDVCGRPPFHNLSMQAITIHIPCSSDKSFHSSMAWLGYNSYI